jgi:hypothetical protein
MSLNVTSPPATLGTFTTTRTRHVEDDLVYRLSCTTAQAHAAIHLVQVLGEFQLEANVLTFADGRFTIKPATTN